MDATSSKGKIRKVVDVAVKGSTGLGVAYLNHAFPIVGALATALAPFVADGVGAIVDATTGGDGRGKISKKTPFIVDLSQLPTVEALTRLLEQTKFSRTAVHTATNCIRAVAVIDPSSTDRYRDWLCQITLANWETKPKVSRFASAILTGIARDVEGFGSFSAKLTARVNTALNQKHYPHSGTVESLSFLPGLEGNTAFYAKMLKLGISDLTWRHKDMLENIAYCGDESAAISNCFDHFLSRTKAGLTSAHDVPRAIHLLQNVPALKQGILADSLRVLTLRSLEWDGKLKQAAATELDRKPS